MAIVLMIVYFALGYWSTGKTIYANKILIGTYQNIFFQRLCIGIFLGFILIPVAIIKSLFGK